MADYKELLRRAISALPENNGAQRRAVYEKARAALVGQLRAIQPPLPARDITTHRLQLEDCIRQVEQEASEANITSIKDTPQPLKTPELKSRTAAEPKPKPASERRGRAEANNQIEDIIAQAERDGGAPPVDSHPPEVRSRPVPVQPAMTKADIPTKIDRPMPSIVARAEAAQNRSAAPAMAAATVADERRVLVSEPIAAGAIGGAAVARKLDVEPMVQPEPLIPTPAIGDVEPQTSDPQVAIDRAIAVLDREARGEGTDVPELVTVNADDEPAPTRGGRFRTKNKGKKALGTDGEPERRVRPAKEFATSRRPTSADTAKTAREGGLGPLTIFLIVFVALLIGAGGASIWAWQEGYINLDSMFGKGQTTATKTAAVEPAVTPDTTGPGNTATPVASTDPSTALNTDQRLPSDAAPVVNEDVAATGADPVAPLALQATNGETKTEDRLGGGSSADASTAEQAVAAIDPANAAGSQSLLLEASDSGGAGATPFTGSVDWTQGKDEDGLPTLVGKANIPARNLSVDLLIRKNSDPSLPASHLMEVKFTVSDSFVGGSIAGLPGVLLKNEELVQGTPLVGASARVVGNSFLFALSASPEDNAANVSLLTSRKWMDLALIYASGKRAIITLEKDPAAVKLFSDVFASWGKSPSKAG